MPIIQLKLGTYHRLWFELASWRRLVRLRLESEQPVNVSIVNDRNLAEYRAGREHDAYGPDRPRRLLTCRIYLPKGGVWNLVIEAMPRKKTEPLHYRDAGLSAEESTTVFYELG